MTMLSEYPTRSEWITGHSAPKTQSKARTVLKLFDEFLDAKQISESQFFEEMREYNSTMQARMIKEISSYWLQRLNPNTVSAYRHKLMGWLEENDIIIPDSKVRRIAPLPKALTEMRYTPDAMHVLKIVNMQKNYEVATFFITLSSTAMRQGELHLLRVSDIDFPNRMIRIPAQHTKTRTERITFFTPETRHYLKKHIKDNGLKDNDRVFKYLIQNYQQHLQRANRIMGFDDFFENKRSKMTMHRFRAYANQCITDAVSERFADVIKGHIGGLRTYDVGNIRKMKKDYDKAIPALTLDKTKQFEDLLDQQENPANCVGYYSEQDEIYGKRT